MTKFKYGHIQFTFNSLQIAATAAAIGLVAAEQAEKRFALVQGEIFCPGAGVSSLEQTRKTNIPSERSECYNI